jgi:hypothetical protein
MFQNAMSGEKQNQRQGAPSRKASGDSGAKAQARGEICVRAAAGLSEGAQGAIAAGRRGP